MKKLEYILYIAASMFPNKVIRNTKFSDYITEMKFISRTFFLQLSTCKGDINHLYFAIQNNYYLHLKEYNNT